MSNQKKCWCTRIARKLTSERGDTLVEALTAILIGGLALLMLAQAISSATNIVRRTQGAMDDYYTQATTLAGTDSSSGYLTLKNGNNPMRVGTESETNVDITVYSTQEKGEDVICYV